MEPKLRPPRVEVRDGKVFKVLAVAGLPAKPDGLFVFRNDHTDQCTCGACFMRRVLKETNDGR